jgi:hypothetical protein
VRFIWAASAHTEKKDSTKQGGEYGTLFRPPATGEYLSGEVYPPAGEPSPSVGEVAELVRNPDYGTLFGQTTDGGTDKE